MGDEKEESAMVFIAAEANITIINFEEGQRAQES